MRRALLSALAVLAALVLQLTVVNGLRLPGGAVPDLVLAVVAALGLASGPMPGAIIGFAAGLCLDLAPPGTGVAGEYALVFCLVGWACGRCRGTLSRSAVLPILIAAAAAAAGEAAVAALGMALQPAQVSWASVQQVLPAAVLYDIAVSPFVLYLMLLAVAWLDTDAITGATAGAAQLRRVRSQTASVVAGSTRTGRQGLAGPVGTAAVGVLPSLGGWLAGPPQSRRARKAAAKRTLRLGSVRPRDGWVGGSAAARLGQGGYSPGGRTLGGQTLSSQALSGQALRGQPLRSQLVGGRATAASSSGSLADRRHGSAVARLRSGVAGSATGGQAPRLLTSRPVQLRLASGRRRDGVLGTVLGTGRPVLTGQVGTGMRLSRASMASMGKRRSRRGGGFRPSAMPGGSAAFRQAGAGALAAPVRFHSSGRSALGRPSGRSLGGSARRGSVLGRLGLGRLGLGWLLPHRSRRRDGVVGGGALTSGGGMALRSTAPRFRIRADGGSAAGLGSSGGLQTLHSIRRQKSPRRLRMRRRRRDGKLGGSLGGGRGSLMTSRPATPRFRARPLSGARPASGKRPRFGYRQVPVLSRLTGRRSWRWRISGKRAGGLR